MKRSKISLLIVALTVVAVMSALRSSARAQAETIVFTAQLLAANEAPPVAVHPSEAGAAGSALVTLDVTRTGGTITAATARFEVSLTGLASNTAIILAHIHEGAAGVNGPVRVDSGLTPGAPILAGNGVATFTRSNLTVPTALAQSIINNPGGFYFNVHSALSPSGIARGQLARQQQLPPGLNAPTLSEWGAILMTLMFIAVGTLFLVGRARTASAANLEAPAGLVAAVDWKLLARVTLYVESAIGLGLVALSAGVVDVVGALTSGLLVAFTLHLFILNSRRQ
jgi:hypothetical protein